MPAIQDYNSDEEFDDDTDLPLPTLSNHSTNDTPPSQPKPSSSSGPSPTANAGGPAGANPMAGLEAMMAAMGGGGGTIGGAGGGGDPRDAIEVEDTTPYKHWHPIYPIYLDAKRAYGLKGGRRIAREEAHWWPLTKDVVAALKSLRMPIFHEPTKTHPKDWANPGRVKTEIQSDDGKFHNEKIKTRKQLYTQVSSAIYRLNPSLPRPANISFPPPAPASIDGDTPTPSYSIPAAPKSRRTRNRPRRTPLPPTPFPPLNKRYSEYSPLIPGGSLLEVLKNERKAALEQAGKAPAAAVGDKEEETKAIEDGDGGAGGKKKKEKKMKTKMVRVGR